MKLRRHFVIYGLVALVAAFLTWHSPPVRSQSGTSQMIESDDSTVTRVGIWTSQAATQASGGSYLYSSGADDDVLTLQFSGPSIEVIFVAGPSLGTLAINVDDIVLRTVITTAETTAYQQSALIDYLSDEPHTLKVYAQASGIVAIDAFVVPTSPPNPLSASSESETSGETRDPFCAPVNQIHRVSLTSTGGQALAQSYGAKLSMDGRYVVFTSHDQLVPADTNMTEDVYLYDRQLCSLQAISINPSGIPSGGFRGSVSPDGRYVAFISGAADLVSGDTNVRLDVFIRDLQTSTTTRLSVASDGTQSDNHSEWPSMSADGRYIAFYSDASNLVDNDTNGELDVFVHDRQTSTTTRISVASDGTEANGPSGDSHISANGQYVAFASTASNLVTGDTNNRPDIFVYAMSSGTLSLISMAPDSTPADGVSFYPNISADGRYVAYESFASNLVAGDTNFMTDVFVHDRQTGTTSRVSVATGGTQTTGDGSSSAAISADGRYIVFQSSATNLVNGDTNGVGDVFVHDRQANTTTRISVTASGSQATGGYSYSPSISGDGRYISFSARATNLVSGDTNGVMDVFVAPFAVSVPSNLVATALSDSQIQLSWTDNASDETDYRIERSPDGLNNWLEIGTAPANTTTYTNVSLMCGTTYHYRVRAYRASDITYSAYSNVANATTSPCPTSCAHTGNIWRMSQSSTGVEGNALSINADISSDGRLVVFSSEANNLIPNDTTSGFSDIFLRDSQTCQIWQINVASNGVQGNAAAWAPRISGNGRYIVFISSAANLAPDNQTNQDIFRHDRLTGQTVMASVSSSGEQGNDDSLSCDVANTGVVTFTTYASNFGPNDADGYTDTYLRDPNAGTTTLVDVSSAGVKSNAGSARDRITPDGRYVMFITSGSNLVPNDTNNLIDIFVRDLQTNTTSIIPLPTPTLPPDWEDATMSDDARFIAFHTQANYRTDDTNGYFDVYLYDRLTSTLTRPGIPAIGLRANGDSMQPVLSGNGRYLLMNVYGNNWYHHDFNNAADVMLVDLQTNITTRVSETSYGEMANNGSWAYAMSTDGSRIALASGAYNFVANGQDFNNVWDVFVKALPHQPSLALFRSDYNATSQLNTLVDLPQLSAYHSFTLNPPPGGYNGQWVMGDWNADGLRTPGVYAPNGVFYITNDAGVAGSTWLGTWFGLYGRPPVVGQFAPDGHDCIGVIDSAHFPPYGTAFALYYTCNLNGGAPPLSFQWLSVVLPDPTFSGTHQFAAGDFNGDGLDSVAVRRGEYIAFTNVAPSDGHAVYDQAQYWGVPLNTAGDEGVFLIGDWDLNNQDSFGVFYQNGYFYRRDDMQWNTGIHILQRIGQPIGAPVTATTWRPQ